ncbi:M20/M25/M40 family metallo-hydrolase [Tunturiibacter empetritectus]|uniref:M20/M25/M40 family metallo-hydrolase n=1 Tax=Tunturiibacter empetritectus TaxID=3069691 RepID=UPI003D9AE94B
MEAKAILSAVEKQQGWIEDTLRDLVQQESPSEDPQAVNAAAALVERWAQEIGARSKRHKQRQFGDVLELRFSPSRSRQQPVLLLGHLDTVWSLGTLKMMPWRNTAGRLWGPGVLDMKAGVIMALTAINTLKKMGLGSPSDAVAEQ